MNKLKPLIIITLIILIFTLIWFFNPFNIIPSKYDKYIDNKTDNVVTGDFKLKGKPIQDINKIKKELDDKISSTEINSSINDELSTLSVNELLIMYSEISFGYNLKCSDEKDIELKSFRQCYDRMRQLISNGDTKYISNINVYNDNLISSLDEQKQILSSLNNKIKSNEDKELILYLSKIIEIKEKSIQSLYLFSSQMPGQYDAKFSKKVIDLPKDVDGHLFFDELNIVQTINSK